MKKRYWGQRPAILIRVQKECGAASTVGEDTKKSWGGMKAVLTALSLFGSVAALLGYGAATVLDTKFGTPYEPLYSSSFELIELSVAAIPQVFVSFVKLDFWRELYFPMLVDFWPPMLGLSLAWAALAILCLKGPTLRQSWKDGKLAKIPSIIVKPKTEQASGWLWKGILYGLIIWALAPGALIIVLVVILTFVVMLTFIPMVGMASASHHVDKYVIEPALCAPLMNRATRLNTAQKTNTQPGKNVTPVAYARCVSVQVPRMASVSGRVIFATYSTMYLFDPATGSVTKVPAKDAIITSIEKL